MRVLVVDDSPLIRGLLGETLAAFGHQVVAEAETADAAIAAFSQHRPDLTTLDLGLADGDGFQVLEKIRAIDPKARVVLITANSQQKAAELGKERGASAILIKPFTTDDVRKIVEG